ncbi:hypothetical protein [Archangium sp.]|uniref:RICIN domain-containing protein n=1 Tax=Archangium sp. TaxID=1872627 RepID=UPI00286B4FEE|nr:hypothetical protein [Archangium sp.]
MNENMLSAKRWTGLMLLAVVGLAVAGCGLPEEQEQAAEEPSNSESALSQGSAFFIRNPGSNLCLYAEGSSLINGDIIVKMYPCTNTVPAYGGNDLRFKWEIVDSNLGQTRLRNLRYGTCLTTTQYDNTTSNAVGELILKSCDVVCACNYNRGYWSNPAFSTGSAQNYMRNGGGNVVTPYDRQLTSGNYLHDWAPEAGNFQNWKWVGW